MERKTGVVAAMQCIACTLIGAALFVVCCLVALLLGDALSPGRLPPMLAFHAACGAGVSLILGLAMLERRGAPHGLAAFEGRRGVPAPPGSAFLRTQREQSRRVGGASTPAGWPSAAEALHPSAAPSSPWPRPIRTGPSSPSPVHD